MLSISSQSRGYFNKHGGTILGDGRTREKYDYEDRCTLGQKRNLQLEGIGFFTKGEKQSIGWTDIDKVKNKKMHDELCNIIDKYEEMARKIGGLYLVEKMLNHIDLPYSEK